MAIKGVVFDCFGVLYRDNISMLYDAVPLEKHRELKDIIHATDHGFLSRDEYYTAIAELGGITPDDVRDIERRQHSRDDAMIAYTQTFKPEYKVGLLSNIDVDTMERLFPHTERSQLFDAFIISGEEGVTKPSTHIFRIGAERLGLQPDECIMIDDIASNVEGAELAGMHGVLFTSRRQLEQDLARLLA